MSTNLKPGRLDSSKDFSAFVPSAFQAANLAFLQANAAFTVANSGSGAASSGLYANAAFLQANSAFTRANNSLNITTGGTVAGDVIITGNLTIQGERTYANTQTVLIADNIITVNAAIDQASAPVFNAGIEVDRGSSANTALLWNESTDKWTATNDGTNYFNLASDAAESYANAAFLQANTPSSTANSAALYANSAFIKANTPPAIANSAALYANGSFIQANAAFIKANNALANTTGLLAGNLTVTGTTTAQKGFVYATKVFPGAQTAITIDITNDSVVRAQTAAGLTVTVSNLLSGKEVSLWITNTSGSNQTFTHGLPAIQSTANATTYAIPSTSTICAKYMCFDETSQNSFVSIIRA